MIRRFIIIVGFLGLALSSVEGTIYRVNNNRGAAVGTNTYTALTQAVFDNAQAGDTIFIEGSLMPYENSPDKTTPFTIAKKLYIIGPGYYLGNNAETQHIILSAKVGSITFAKGSAGSSIEGIEQICPDDAYGNAVNTTNTALNKAPKNWPKEAPTMLVQDNEITITSCRLYYVLLDNSDAGAVLDRIIIQKCWFGPGVIITQGNILGSAACGAIANLSISNNFFSNQIIATDSDNKAGSILLDHETKGTIAYNTFFMGFKIVASCKIDDNAFFFTTSTWGNLSKPASSTENSKCKGNVSSFALTGIIDDPPNNRVIAGGSPCSWFSCTSGLSNSDGYFEANREPNSPLFLIGGKECGMFGGSTPYVLSGLTKVPAVFEIVMPYQVSGTGFDITVKVKAH